QLEGIRDVNDGSAKGLTRLVIELKRDANANVVLNNLWKHTALQSTFAVNMVALVDGVPRTLNLAQAISAYVDHQIVVVRRRSEFRLKKAEDRAHIVEGRLKALDKIDEVIKLIRASADRELRDVIKEELEVIKKKYGDDRRTALAADAGEMNLEDLIHDEEVVVVRTQAGYINTVQASNYRVQQRGGRGVQGANLKEADL